MRIFDCVLYNGEIKALLLRLHELQDSVDVFVIVESTKTFSGEPKTLRLRVQWAKVRSFARKIRYVVSTDDVGHGCALDREGFQRNSILRGLLDTVDSDLICISAVDEIPNANVIRQLRDAEPRLAGLTPYFSLNSTNTDRTETNLASCCAFSKRALLRHTPDQLYCGIRNGSIAADQFDNATRRFLHRADPTVFTNEIPIHSRPDVNGLTFSRLIDLPDDGSTPPVGAHTNWARGQASFHVHTTSTIIICPYVFDEDREQAIQAFGLDQPHGCHLPFFFWKDEMLIGPERAFEHCWKQFPDRDVIIVHTDMRPMPHDENNSWYTALCAQAEQLPDAGLIGCDLLYPLQSPSGHWYVQCAGGHFKNGQIGHFGGGVALADRTASEAAYKYDERFAKVRRSQWVTFGGVYIRRETIDMVGDFDSRYQWAYVMDVDYCLEAHIRGQGIYQVPVNLLHEESKTSKKFLVHPEYSNKTAGNLSKFVEKWAWYLDADA